MMLEMIMPYVKWNWISSFCYFYIINSLEKGATR